MPVTVASAEKTFLKLNLLRNYMRSTMSQEKLNSLAILCIEKKLFDEKSILILSSPISHLKMLEETFEVIYRLLNINIL